MRVKIVTFYDDAMCAVGDVTRDINEQYATGHGYSFVCYRTRPDPNLNPSWNKLKVVQQEMGDYDWIFWLDADAVFVNKTRSLDDLFASTKKPMLVSSDTNGVCCGIFALRNCAWSVQLLTTWLFLGEMPLYSHRRFHSESRWEQDTFKALLSDFISVYSNVGVIPEDVIQNPDSAFCPDALIMHYWYSGLGRHADPILLALQALRENGGQYSPACRPPK